MEVGGCDAGRSCRGKVLEVGGGSSDPVAPVQEPIPIPSPPFCCPCPVVSSPNQPTNQPHHRLKVSERRGREEGHDMDISFVPFHSLQHHISRITTNFYFQGNALLLICAVQHLAENCLQPLPPGQTQLKGPQELPSSKAISFEHLHITGSYRLSRG